MSTPMFDLPAHLPMGVTKDGRGPEDDKLAHHYECWCGDPSCQLTAALKLADRAGVRRVATQAGLEDSIATTLARRHKCLDHNGPGSGPCKTDRERATLVMGVLAAATMMELE